MEKKNQKLFIILGILLLSVGVSLAYFTSKVLNSGEGASTNVTTAEINGAKINVEGILEFNDLDILPGHKSISGIKLTAAGNGELIPYNLLWEGTNTITTQLNFVVYKANEPVEVNTICKKKIKAISGAQTLSEECNISNLDKLGIEIATGTINKGDSEVVLIENESITADFSGNKIYYYIILEYPNLNEPQNIDIGGKFEGKVIAKKGEDLLADITINKMYQKIENDYEEITNMPSEGYQINKEKSTCTNNAIPILENNKILVTNLTNSGTECNIYFDKLQTSEDTLKKLNISNNRIHTDEPDFTKNATESEIKLGFQHITNLTNLTNDTTYPFDYDEKTGIFISTNKVNSSTSTLTFSPSEEINEVKICYVVSSEENYDKAIIYLDETKKEEISGEKNSCIELGKINSSNIIKVEYVKDQSQSKGKDQVEFYLANSVEEYIPNENNGIYKTADPMYEGESYYWRGAATTNHVIFANKCWRIVRINGDGSIRLIYNGDIQSGNTCTGNGSNSGSIAIESQAYNSNYNRSEYVGYTYTVGVQRQHSSKEESNLKTQTEAWFNSNITRDNLQKIAEGKFCNDRNAISGSRWVSQGNTFRYAAYGRLVDNKAPTLSCNVNDIYTLKVGAITADELVFAGGLYGIGNSSYYLYNGKQYWTMSPFDWFYSSYYNRYAARTFSVDGSGAPTTTEGTSTTGPGIRPVINLRPDVTFNSGSDGTQNNPYIVKGA